MKKKILVLAMCMFIALPGILRAEEVTIQLMEVIGMGTLPGDNPLDDPEQTDPEPTRPNSFHATINGNTLSIINQEPASIPSAQAIVVNASTGNIVLNRQFTTSLQEQISNAGVYVLHIETAGGALVGQFVVQ